MAGTSAGDIHVHFRRCHDCGHIYLNESDFTPGVFCKRCKSQDTRRMKNEPPLWSGVMGEQRGVYVPEQVAKCPECETGLIATCYEWEAETGRPVATGIELMCLSYLRKEGRDLRGQHTNSQDKWQPVRDAVAKWCDARIDYPNR